MSRRRGLHEILIRRLVMSWLSRLKNALNSHRLDDDLQEELLDHLERRSAALRECGLADEEARRRAALRFGNHPMTCKVIYFQDLRGPFNSMICEVIDCARSSIHTPAE
jgi:hypothetical protein